MVVPLCRLCLHPRQLYLRTGQPCSMTSLTYHPMSQLYHHTSGLYGQSHQQRTPHAQLYCRMAALYRRQQGHLQAHQAVPQGLRLQLYRPLNPAVHFPRLARAPRRA